MNQHPNHMMRALIEREQKGLIRQLKSTFPSIDFCSNDYLGFSKLGLLRGKVNVESSEDLIQYGATGSRLMSGNSVHIEEAEKQIALFHHAKSALLFNSGYDANIGLLSSIAQRTDLILYDEFVHASVVDGIRLSSSTHYKFHHNVAEALDDLIQKHHKNFENIFVVVESVYALDGDTAPLIEITEICERSKNVFLIVDEAHAIGVYGTQGRGLCNALNIEQKCFARIYTYGKAMGCHGAVVVGGDILTKYLINFARSFIYTTALPGHSIDAILYAYQLLIETDQKEKLQKNIAYFYQKTSSISNCIKSQSAIHSIVAGSNEMADKLESMFTEKSIHVRTMKNPTVKSGAERVRISIHSYNTREEIDLLVEVLKQFY